MTRRQRVKGLRLGPFLVGVVTSLGDLRAAARLRTGPDFFELRLDHLCDVLDDLERELPALRDKARLVFTARDAREGGARSLSHRQRQKLFARFLKYASYIDIELRSVRSFEPLLTEARKRKIGWIISVHNFTSTPSVRVLNAKARAASEFEADIFKIATRTDSKTELDRLVEFFLGYKADVAISAMGVGKLGRESRRQLMRLGSVLNYASVGSARIPGQPSLSEMQKWPRLR